MSRSCEGRIWSEEVLHSFPGLKSKMRAPNCPRIGCKSRAEAKYYPHKNTRTRLIDLVGRGFEYKKYLVRSTTSRMAWEEASTGERTLKVVSSFSWQFHFVARRVRVFFQDTWFCSLRGFSKGSGQVVAAVLRCSCAKGVPSGPRKGAVWRIARKNCTEQSLA